MARRRNKKVPPTELTITANLATAGSHICDIGELMSQINRKKFRQGMQYAVQSIEFYSPAADIIVSRLPHHWCGVNAWTKTMELWRQQQNEKMFDAGIGDTIAAHRDFKIFADAAHADGSYDNLNPFTLATGGPDSQYYRSTTSAQTVSPTVEKAWDKSQVVIPNATGAGTASIEYYCHMLGDDAFGGATASFGMIKAYAESRARPMSEDPNIVNVARGGIFGDMTDVGADSGLIVGNAQDQNAHLPYLNDMDSSFEFYPGGTNQGSGWTVEDTLSIQAGNRTLSSSVCGPFLANVGLILMTTSTDNVQVKITLAPGHYNGVAARPMQDVN